jgi:hypothetical protein
MKKKYTLILITLIVIFSLGIVMKMHPEVSRSSKIVDLSYIKLPEYSLPEGYITKQQAIDIALNAAKSSLRHGQVPKNPQCVLLPGGIGEELLYGNSQPAADKLDQIKKEMVKYGLKIPADYKTHKKKYEEYQGRLLYFVVLDVNRYPDEVLMRTPPHIRIKLINNKWVTTQDVYKIDALTGKIVGHGYYGVIKHILPKQ